MKKRFYNILRQYFFGKIKPEDFNLLRSELDNISEQDLETSMLEIWDDKDNNSELPLDTKLRVINSINSVTPQRKRLAYYLKIASIIILPLLLTWGPYLYFSQQKTNISTMMVMTGAGQKTQMLLPDGSKVWLNAKSSLNYPSNFGETDRVVQLEGEGYFEIEKDAQKKFIVKTQNTNVIVHGTKFNVKAMKEASHSRISLIEGSISIEDKKNKHLALLHPQQTISISNKNSSFVIDEEDTSLAALWSLNMCRFENLSTLELYEQAEYWYGVTIHLDDKFKFHRYTLTIKNESFREFLYLINELTPIEYSIEGEEVHIRYK